MSFLLSKLLPLFVYPLGLAILFCLIAFVLLQSGRKLGVSVFILSAVVILWVSSTAVFADYVMGSLEKDYPPVAQADVPQADAILVLGGMTQGIPPGGVFSDLADSADRLFQGVMLYKSKKAPVIILSGGGADNFPPEAELMANILQNLGIPLKDMLLETKSRNTYQNAVYSVRIMQEQGIHKILLVTSANHMKRAVAVFQSLGVSVIPVPCDYQVVQREALIIDWLPTAEAIHQTTNGIKEYIGWWYYSMRGWL